MRPPKHDNEITGKLSVIEKCSNDVTNYQLECCSSIPIIGNIQKIQIQLRLHLIIATQGLSIPPLIVNRQYIFRYQSRPKFITVYAVIVSITYNGNPRNCLYSNQHCISVRSQWLRLLAVCSRQRTRNNGGCGKSYSILIVLHASIPGDKPAGILSVHSPQTPDDFFTKSASTTSIA
jgi:hypothetical protein